MLKVIFEDSPVQRIFDRTWHVDKQDFITNNEINFVSEVIASDDELNWIIDNIRWIPLCSVKAGGIVRWFGDHAKFIAGRLPIKND